MIVDEGDKVRSLYIVAEGSVEFLAPFRKSDVGLVVLAVKGPSEYFGATRCGLRHARRLNPR